MEQPILHGIEYEIQLMLEIEGELRVVHANEYLIPKYLPQCVTLDLGNIEISTPPRGSYKEAVESANYILSEKLIPALINDFKFEKFALFLPTPMCRYFDRTGFTNLPLDFYKEVCCLKHWNISIPIEKELLKNYKYSMNNEFYPILDDIMDKICNNWIYDYKKIISKGFPIILKDSGIFNESRVHIKIPYHYAPIMGNPDLLPKFEDTLIPPERWKNLVCFYRNGNVTKVRDLI